MRTRSLQTQLPFVLCLLILGMTAEPSLAQTPGGRPFWVNSISRKHDEYPHAAIDADGSFVVVWNHDREPHRIWVRKFDSRGKPVTSEFPSSGALRGDHAYGAIPQGPAGFLTLWKSGRNDYARRHLPTGEPIGDPILINRPACSDERCRDGWLGFDQDPSGGFVGVWLRVIPGRKWVFARWFDGQARPHTSEIPLSDDRLAVIDRIYGIAAGPERTIAVAWSLVGSSNEFKDLIVQTYSAEGEKIGNGFVAQGVDRYGGASLSSNPFTHDNLIVWNDLIPKEPCAFCHTFATYAQRLRPDGSPLDPEPLFFPESGQYVGSTCNMRGYCVLIWPRQYDGSSLIETRIMRPDGTLAPRVAAIPDDAIYRFGNESLAYGSNGVLMVAGMDIQVVVENHEYVLRSNIVGRRLIASPGDEVCQRIGRDIRCSAGRSDAGPTFSLLPFDLDVSEQLLLGDADGDGRADPCRVRSGVWRCDTDHEGDATETVLRFAGAASGIPLLGDLDGNGRAEACSWSAGILRCDTAHNSGAPELSLSYGRPGETPLLGDLDGDGREDLCMASKGALRCDVGHDGGRTETRFSLGLAGDVFVLGDFDGNGTDDPCLVRTGKLLCDTAHDGGEPDAELFLGTPGAPVLLGNLDGV